MTIDKEKLKALAEAANAVAADVNITMAVGSAPEEVKAVQDFLQQAMPKTILALLAEIERLLTSRSKKSESLNKSLKPGATDHSAGPAATPATCTTSPGSGEANAIAYPPSSSTPIESATSSRTRTLNSKIMKLS